MNEEEKKAVEKIKEIIECFYCFPNPTSIELKDCDCSTLEIALNLIKKLQKENEELKEYIAIAPNLDEMTATKYRNIQQDAYIQGRAEEKQRAKQIIYENYIPVQKVKDKIEHYQKLQDNYIEKYDEINEGLQAMINALQELLEGRK